MSYQEPVMHEWDAVGCCVHCGDHADSTGSDSCMDVHTFFGLTYSNYLVLNRSILQSMPLEWQVRFVGCLNQLQCAVDEAGVEVAARFDVRARNDDGTYGRDPIPHYNRGRTQIPGLLKDGATT